METRLVPKIHPASRPVEPDDPMTLNATPVPGDPEVMLRCIVQEYAWMGWDAGQILELFNNPCYPVLHDLSCFFGAQGLRKKIGAILKETAVLRFRAAVVAEADQEEEEADANLVQLGMPEGWGRV